MSDLNRRRFLQSAGLTTAGLAAVGCCQEGNQPAAAAEVKPAVAPGVIAAKPLNFNLGIVTFGYFKTWELKDVLRVCKAVGLSPIEFRTGDKHGIEPTLTKMERKDIRKQIEDSGVKIWGCGTTCEFHWPNKKQLQDNIDLCKKFIELVHDLGGVGVKVRPNKLPPGVPEAKTLEQIGKSMIPCGDEGKKLGVVVSMEVHGDCRYPHMAKKIMEVCNHPNVGLTWNSNDTDIMDKKTGSVAEAFKMLWPWVRSCHIHRMFDDPMFKDPRKKQAKGIYPYRELFTLLREAGYDKQTQIECGTPNLDPKCGEELLHYYKGMWTKLATP